MMNLWNDLQAFLKVDLEISTADASDSRSATTLNFTVSNTAPEPGPSQPNIQFEDISLKIVRGSSTKSVNLGRHLSAGQSLSYGEQAEAHELLDLRYYAEASISPTAFFRINNAPAYIQFDRGILDAKAYLQFFEGCNIHFWRDSIDVAENIYISFAKYLSNAAREVSDQQLRLQRFLSMIQRGERLVAEAHHQIAHQYLEQVSRELTRLIQEFNTGNESRISRAKERFATHLRTEGSKVDVATDELRRQFEPAS